MPAPLKPKFDFHGGIKKFLQDIKPTLKGNDKVVLQYGWKEVPFAKLIANFLEYTIPTPVSPGVYKDWGAWFKYYLEVQVALAAKEVGVKVYVRGNKNNLLEIYDGSEG